MYEKILKGDYSMVYDKVMTIISEQLGVQIDDISIDNSLKDDLGADSLNLYEISEALEQEFDVEINEEKMNYIETVEDIIRVLKELDVEE